MLNAAYQSRTKHKKYFPKVEVLYVVYVNITVFPFQPEIPQNLENHKNFSRSGIHLEFYKIGKNTEILLEFTLVFKIDEIQLV